MNVNVPCPQCGTVFTVRRELLGKRTKCTRCGTAFMIAESAPAQTQPAPVTPPAASHVFSELQVPPPAPISTIPQISTEPMPRVTSRPAPPQESFGFEETQPRFPILRLMARGYEILAALVLVFAFIVLLMFVIAVVRQPTLDVIVAAVLTSGLAFFWATLIAISMLAFAQAIRLALAIEQNTRQTHQACRQLADHLCAIETEP